MPVTIKQKVKFAVSPSKVYKFYTDQKLHAKITGGKAKISTEAGSSFSAFDGNLKGKILRAKKGKLVVQTWRSSGWTKEDDDSILVLVFRAQGEGTELEMVHVNVPDHDVEGVKNGWREYYWNPWKQYIKDLNKPKSNG